MTTTMIAIVMLGLVVSVRRGEGDYTKSGTNAPTLNTARGGDLRQGGV
jgi:hypothetical protein